MTTAQQYQALCCECGALRMTTACRGATIREELDGVGMRCVVRRKCKECGTTTNHAYLLGEEEPGDPSDDLAAKLIRKMAAECRKIRTGMRQQPYGWYTGRVEDIADRERQDHEYYAEILADADRHGEWYPPMFVGRTPESVASELWHLGIRLRAAEDHSKEDKGGRRCAGRWDWWIEQSETVVTPDLRATPEEVVVLLRAAEYFLGDEMLKDVLTPKSTPDGPVVSVCRFASEQEHATA